MSSAGSSCCSDGNGDKTKRRKEKLMLTGILLKCYSYNMAEDRYHYVSKTQ